MRENEIAKLYCDYFKLSDDVKKMFEKALSRTYSVKQEALATCMLKLVLDYRKMDDVQRMMKYLDVVGYHPELKEYLTALRNHDPEWSDSLEHIMFEYGKNGHDILSAMTPIHEMSPDQLDAYILKIKENTALKGEKSDEEICGEMLSVFAETGAPLTYDEAKHISSNLGLYPELLATNFTVGIINGNYYIMSKGSEAIALPIEKPNELDRDTFMQIAEIALNRANESKEDVSTTLLTDTQVRRRLTAYTYVAIQYQGIARELVKELTPQDFEDKTPPPPEKRDAYEELIEKNNQLYLDKLNREKLYEENEKEDLEEDYGMSL